MATYGYSAGYQGGGPSAVPSGYIEAYAQAGRNIGQGVQAIGNAIGESLARYGQNKAESEFVQARYEQLRPYIDTVARTGNVMDERSPESKLLADVGKFSTMSLPQKKAALMNAEFYLDRADKQRARELTDEATRQQLALGALQLGDIQEKRRQNEILTSAIKYGLEQPTSQTVTEQTQVPVSVQYQPEGPFSIAPQQAETTMRPEQFYSEQAPAFRPLQQPQFMRPQGLPGTQTPPSSIPKTWESVLGAKFANQLGTPVKSDLFKPTTAQNQGVTTFETTKEVPVTSEKVVPYEEQSKRLTQFLIQQGAKPETLAMVPQILSMVGQQRPTRVEQVGNMGAVVRFGDKEQFVPAKEANIGDMLKVKGLTIDFPEFQGTAPSLEEAKLFREQYKTVLDSRRDITRLLEIAGMGKAMQQSPKIKAEADQLARSVQGALRLDILGAGTVSEPDRKLLESIVRNPTDIFSLPSSNTKSLEGLLSRATNGITTRAQSLGLQALTPQSGQSRSSLASDPRVASIRARMNSGAITRQQAAQELKSLQ
jgi:hypothetical protein